MTKYYIRPYEKTDTAFLWEMLYQSIYVPAGEAAPSRTIVEKPEIAGYLRDWGRPQDYALLAVNPAGESVGAVWIRLFSPGEGGYGFVDEETPELGMAVVGEYRGQGIGRQLLTAMIGLARQVGFRGISLSVDPRNEAAVRLYGASGFVWVRADEGGSWIMQITL